MSSEVKVIIWEDELFLRNEKRDTIRKKSCKIDPDFEFQG